MSISPFANKYVAYPAAPVNKSWPDKYQFILVDDLGEFGELLSKNRGKVVAFDTETTGLDFEKDRIVGFSLSWDGITGYYIPVRHSKPEWNISENPTTPLKMLHQHLLESKLVFYANRRFDDTMMEYENWDESFENEIDADSWGGFNMENIKGFDVTHFCYLCDTDNFKMIGLKPAAAHFLGIQMMEFSEASGGASFKFVNPKDGTYYAASDAICTYLLGKLVLNNGTYTNAKQSAEIDNSFMYVLEKAEREKTKLDFRLLDKFEGEIMSTLESIQDELYEIAGYPFNINSSKQVGKLFTELGIDTGVRTETGSMSVGAKAIESMSEEDIEEYPFLKSYVKYKRMEKLRSSYIEVLKRIKAKGKEFARVPYKTNNTATGRLASGAGANTKGSEFYSASLNIQNIPKQKPMEYYVYDVGNRGLWYEDLVPEEPLILLNGYLMVPVWYLDNKIVDPSKDNEIEGRVNDIIEIIEGKLNIEIGAYKDFEYMGVTESGSPELNIRSLFKPTPMKNEEYYRLTLDDGNSYYLEMDGIDGVMTTEDEFIVAEEITDDLDIKYIISGGVRVDL